MGTTSVSLRMVLVLVQVSCKSVFLVLDVFCLIQGFTYEFNEQHLTPICGKSFMILWLYERTDSTIVYVLWSEFLTFWDQIKFLDILIHTRHPVEGIQIKTKILNLLYRCFFLLKMNNFQNKVVEWERIDSDVCLSDVSLYAYKDWWCHNLQQLIIWLFVQALLLIFYNSYLLCSSHSFIHSLF